MVHRVAVALIVALAFGTTTAATAVTCTAAQITAGQCSVGGATNGGGVDLWGDLTFGGDNGGTGDDDFDECPTVVNGQCVGSSPPKDGNGPTTVEDLESFRPIDPLQYGEPGGWAIRRVPVNFWSTASAHVVAGELLGNPAEVQFTPIRFRRYFGDGERLTSGSAGSPWQELGQSHWTRTPTSHSYRATGEYRVRLLVWYSASFRFGSQVWTPLVGEVTAWANPLSVTVFSSDTLLVDRPCSPNSPGCPFG